MTDFNTKPMGGRLGVSGFLQYRDKDGNVLKEVEVSGSIPLTSEQAQELVQQQQEQDNGTHNRE